MRSTIRIATVVLVLMYLACSAAMSFGILEGLAIFSALAGKGGKPEQVTVTKGEISMTATPVMAIPTGFGFKLQSMTFNVTAGTGLAPDFYHPVFPVLKCLAPDGNPIMLVPIDWQPNGKPLQNLLVTLDNEPITKAVDARSLVENEGAWLRRAIREANRDLGRQYEDSSNVPDTFFEPFIAMSKDVKHSLTADKRHNFNSPTGSVNMMLVFPMGNLFSRPHFVACNLKQPGKGDNSYNCSFHFRVLDEPVEVPAPFESIVPMNIDGKLSQQQITQPAQQASAPSAQVAGTADNRTLGSAPQPQQPQYQAPAPQQQAPQYQPPAQQSQPSIATPPTIDKAAQFILRPGDQAWWKPCSWERPSNWTPGDHCSVVLFFLDRRYNLLHSGNLDERDVEWWINGDRQDMNLPSHNSITFPDHTPSCGVIYQRMPSNSDITLLFRGKRYGFSTTQANILWRPIMVAE